MDAKQTSGSLPCRTALAGAVSTVLLVARVSSAAADETVQPIPALPPISIGVGLQTSIYACDKSCIYSPSTVSAGDNSVQGVAVDSIRLYINGSVTNTLKFTFNTEYTGSGPGDNKVEVMDAIGRFEYNSYFNIWAGRFLPPSDRANFYGPYFANDWAPYADSVAAYYPNVASGRDNGLAYWGDFGMFKVQLGAFDGESLNSAVTDKSKILGAARVTLDFWDKESGYYLYGTYYGDKNVLALGAAGQIQDRKSAWNIDGLLEKKLGGAGVVTVEAEYQKDNGLTAATPSDGWYVLGSYLFPRVVGVGKFQPLVKYSDKTFNSVVATYPDVGLTPSYKLKTTEVNLNYVIKEFSARVGFYYLNQTSSTVTPAVSAHEFGVKLQLQM
jgi:hypothetical protein